ncbi:hypothetical protein [Clostridium perfringens]
MIKPPIVRRCGKSILRKTIIDVLSEHTFYVELLFGDFGFIWVNSLLK